MQQQQAVPQFTINSPCVEFSYDMMEYFRKRGEVGEHYKTPSDLKIEVKIPYDDVNEHLYVRIKVENTNSQTYAFDIELTAWLAIFECYGPDADYEREFVQFAASRASSIVEHGFRRTNVRPRKARYFRGRIVENAEYGQIIARFFKKYGIGIHQG